MQPRLFSRTTIFAFSILLSTIFGALLFSTNLSQVDKKEEIGKVIILSFIWNLVLIKLLPNIIHNPLFTYFIINGLGGYILAKPMWDHDFKEISAFERKPIWGPLAVTGIVILTFVGLYFLY